MRDSAATVSLKLGSLDTTSNSSSRAIAQGSGCLYLRTIGGPTGDSGPFYGPYSVSSGGTFSTTDLPAGKFTGIIILYSANKLDETKTFSYNGGTYTFRQLMNLSDDVLMSEDSSVDGTALLDFFDGEASTSMTKEVTLTAGSTTALSATLIPIPGSKYFLNLAESSSLALPATSATVRKFYWLYGSDAAKDSTISCTATPGASGTATIGTIALYGSDGKLLSASSGVGTITAAKTLTATATGDTSAFVYIEYQASDLTLSFSGMSSSLTCSFAGNTDWPNKTLYIEVYDSSLSSTTVSPTNAGYLGVGVITTDSEGNGTGVIYDYVTGKAIVPLAGHTYCYKAFIDNKSRYASYTSATAVRSSGILGAIEPNYGDYTASSESGFVAASGENKLSLNIGSFTSLTTATLYVASAARGTGSGLDSLNAYAFADLSNLLALFSDATGVNIVLMGNVDLSTALTLSGSNVRLTSCNQPGYTISYTNTAAYLNVTATAFSMANVTLDGTGASGLSNSAVIISQYTTAASLGTGTVIQNMTSGSSVCGAALAVAGSVSMTGATIKNCSTQTYGGGVYMVAGSLNMGSGASITGCTAASSYGGGVYMAAGSLTMEAGSSITGCTANTSGGGIYADSAVTALTLNEGASITGNKAGTSGGGVYSVAQSSAIADSVIAGNYLLDGTTASNLN